MHVFMCSLCFEGMSCYRSNFSCWKRLREALTSSHAVIIPSVCSEGLTTACILKNGLQLQKPSSLQATSVSSLRRTVCSVCDTRVLCMWYPSLFPLSLVNFLAVYNSWHNVDVDTLKVESCHCHFNAISFSVLHVCWGICFTPSRNPHYP